MKALITGATSGIGEAYAKKFAQLGYDLILTGRREDLLTKLSSTIIEQFRVKVEVLKVELSNEEQLHTLVSKVKQTYDLEVLVNNAGFGSRSSFLEEDIFNQENMVKVHVLAPMKLVHAALPGMITRDRGVIINVASISGKTPLPTGAIYSATKSFLQIFSESLHLENLNSNIVVQCLCPGFTRTDFHKKLDINIKSIKETGIIRWMSAEEVVEYSLRNLRKGKVICVPGLRNKVLWFLSSVLPRPIYYKLVSRVGERKQVLNSHLAQHVKWDFTR